MTSRNSSSHSARTLAAGWWRPLRSCRKSPPGSLEIVRHDGNRRARRLNGPYRRRAHRDDDVHLFLDQLGRQARKPGGIAVGDARHQLDLLSLAAGATQS